MFKISHSHNKFEGKIRIKLTDNNAAVVQNSDLVDRGLTLISFLAFE